MVQAAAGKLAAPSVLTLGGSAKGLADYFSAEEAKKNATSWINRLPRGNMQFVPSQTVNYCNSVPGAETYSATALLSTNSRT